MKTTRNVKKEEKKVIDYVDLHLFGVVKNELMEINFFPNIFNQVCVYKDDGLLKTIIRREDWVCSYKLLRERDTRDHLP